MDVRRYRLAAPRIVAWPGTVRQVGVRALSAYELQIAQQSSAESGETAAMLFVLASVLVDPLPPHHRITTAGILPSTLTPDEAVHLIAVWREVQADDVPEDMDVFQRGIRLGMMRDGRIIVDGMMASCSDDIASFYGLQYVDLTHGQVVYWLACRATYRDLYESPEKGYTRAISKEVLESWPS